MPLSSLVSKVTTANHGLPNTVARATTRRYAPCRRMEVQCSSNATLINSHYTHIAIDK